MPSRHLVVAERRRWSSKRRSRWADLSFSPSRGISSSLWKALLVAALAAPCFPPKSPVHSTLVPGPTEPGNWPFFLDEQFRRTIIGPLLIPATATPGRLKQFLDWTSLAAWRARGFQQAILGLQRACERAQRPPREGLDNLYFGYRLSRTTVLNYSYLLRTCLPTDDVSYIQTVKNRYGPLARNGKTAPKLAHPPDNGTCHLPTCPPAESPGPGLAARHQPGTPAAQRDQLRTPSHHISRVAFGPNFLSSRGVQCGVLRKGCFLLSVSLRQSRTRSADARVSPRRGSCAI
jgi:hypothetical protein